MAEQLSMNFAGSELQTLLDKWKKLPTAHLRKTPLDSKFVKRWNLPKGTVALSFSWGANTVHAFTHNDQLVAMLLPESGYDIFKRIEELLGIKDFRQSIAALASDSENAGYNDLYRFNPVAEQQLLEQLRKAIRAEVRKYLKNKGTAAKA